MGQPLTSFHCQRLIQRFKPNFYFFMKTRIDVRAGRKHAERWGFKYCEGIPNDGLSGGLLVLWDVEVSICFMNKNVVLAYIIDGVDSF
ncbi:hypothetical protein PTKIN_Ptkin08bG0007500 [Pterospermum kingtungense]